MQTAGECAHAFIDPFAGEFNPSISNPHPHMPRASGGHCASDANEGAQGASQAVEGGGRDKPEASCSEMVIDSEGKDSRESPSGSGSGGVAGGAGAILGALFVRTPT